MSELINIGPTNLSAGLDFEGWTCPLPLRDSPNIVMGHGGGGQMSAELIDHLFIPALGGRAGGESDSAVFELGGVRLAFSTDTFVVRPLFFPGGSIGHLAINGTVNDLAMSGAVPSYLSAGFVLEEGTDCRSSAGSLRTWVTPRGLLESASSLVTPRLSMLGTVIRCM